MLYLVIFILHYCHHVKKNQDEYNISFYEAIIFFNKYKSFWKLNRIFTGFVMQDTFLLFNCLLLVILLMKLQ